MLVRGIIIHLSTPCGPVPLILALLSMLGSFTRTSSIFPHMVHSLLTADFCAGVSLYIYSFIHSFHTAGANQSTKTTADAEEEESQLSGAGTQRTTRCDITESYNRTLVYQAL